MHPLGTNHKDANQKLDANKNASIEHASWEILIINLAHLGRYFTLNHRLHAHTLEVKGICVILVFSQVRADGQNGLQQQRYGPPMYVFDKSHIFWTNLDDIFLLSSLRLSVIWQPHSASPWCN